MGAICSCCRPKNVIIPSPNPSPVYRVPSPPMEREDSSDSPFTDMGVATKDPLILINGYQNEPLVSLEEALQPIVEKNPALAEYIREAKTKCYYPAKPKLTRDESAAIYIYTMRWGHKCLYDDLQAAWKSDKRSELKPWFKYLKLFKSAYDKLPNAKGEIWKGKSFDPKKMEAELSSKSSSYYIAMDIFSPSKSAVEQSLRDNGAEQMIFTAFKSTGGKLVRDYAASNRDEVLVWPGMNLALSESEWNDDDTSLTVHLTGSAQSYEPPKVSPTVEKHFVCYNKDCNHE